MRSTNSIRCYNSECSLTLGSENASLGFYRVRKFSENMRSGWSTYCKSCLKVRVQKVSKTPQFKQRRSNEKKKYYEAHKKTIKAYKKDYYYKTNGKEKSRQQYHLHKREISERNAIRRLERSKDPNKIIELRKYKSMSELQKCLWRRLTSIKNSSHRRGLDFSLTFDGCWKKLEEQKLNCFYSDQPLQFVSNSPMMLSVDRINSAKGYILENIVFCGHIFNLMKHVSSIKNFINFCKQVASNEENINNRL